MEPMLRKCVTSSDIVTGFNARGKHALADANCYCKMTSVVVLDGVTLFLRLNDVTYLCKHMRHSPTISGISSVQWRKILIYFKIPIKHGFLIHVH